MDHRHEDQQRRQQLLTIVDRGSAEQLFTFLQAYHRRPFRNITEVMGYDAAIDDQIDFIDCVATRYNVTPLIIAAGKGSYEKTKILLVHGANPNKQCSTGDTALNLAVHRQKYRIVDLLLTYRANPNIFNKSGKTALHRAAVSYIDDNANHVRALLNAGADPALEDRNQRIALDEAALANKPEITSVLLSHDPNLVQRAYRAAIIAARLGHDRCLETLLDYGMDPNICDRTHTSPLHVAVRSLKLSTARLLVSHGADKNLINNRGETPIGIAEYLQPDQQQSFVNVLIHTPRVEASGFHVYSNGSMPANAIPYVHPLLRSHPNWTLDSEEFRSPTDNNSSVQNLLDTTSGSYWCCRQNKDAWVIFDLKHQYNISGMRIIGCDNQSTPRSGHIDVSTAFNGPWLKVKDFTCPLSQGNKNDVFFQALKTRFIRVFLSDNYGGDDIRVQGIGFYGVDMRLVDLLREHGLERSLPTLLANSINDLESLDENRDEILNSSDKYLDVNDHFLFIRLMESLRSPKLTRLEWFNPPQSTVIAGDKLQTFSAAGDEGVTDRVKLEERLEQSSQIRTVLMRDLEPIQGRSLVDFPDYVIRDPGRYKVRVVSVESPNIQTPWQDIVVGAKLPTFPTEKPIPRRPSSTPPTDLDDEFIEPRPNFGPGKRFPNTPRPKRDRRDDDSDSIIGNRSPNRQPKIDTQKSKLIDESTQSEEKLTRNVGTMHEPVQTRNFGNEVQPQSSSTQTTFLPAKKTPKTDYSFIERPEPRPIKYDDDDDYYPDRRSSPIPRQPTPRVIYDDPYDIILHQYIKCRTPSNSPPRRETIDYVYDGHYPACYETPYDDYTVLPEDTRHSHRPRSRPPPSAYSPCTIVTHRSRTSSPPPQHRHIVTPSPSHPVRCPSSPRRPRSATPRRRVQMHSQETDTSLDAMKRKHHTGVQYEPLSTREKGTTPSLRMRKPPTNHRSTTLDASIYSQHRYPIPHSTIPLDFNRSRRTHFHQPPTTTYDYREHRNQSSCNDYDDSGEEEEEEDEIRSMHDQSTMAELLVYLDHYTQCESQPFMADRYIQTTPTVDDNDNEHGNTFENGEESFIRQLPRSGSISIPQPIIIQPDTLPRRRQPQPQPSPTRPKRDGLDYTGNILEVSLHHGQLQRTASIRDSPLLNIGTENILNQPVAHEYATPFETRFIYESDSLSTLGSRKNGSMIAPVLNSARTHMFTQSPVRQSRSNGNFYLSTAPSRSSNSSIRVDITAEKS